jgi:AcrR family transcriptional regulator
VIESDRSTPPPRRRYDNSRRRAEADATRHRMVDAGCELARESDVRDWKGLTMAAVAARADVSERTVYRHFGSEGGLRDAVMHEIEQRAGIDLVNLRIEGVADAAARIFRQVAAFRPVQVPDLDPTLRDAGRRQREALEAAVADAAPGGVDDATRAAAAVLDVLWSPAAYERLVTDWAMTPDAAVAALVGAVRLMERAVSSGAWPVDDTTNS